MKHKAVCREHDRELVCPTCVAIERGRKGGITRARRAMDDPEIAAAGRRGGKRSKKRFPMTPPGNLCTLLDNR